MSGRAADWFRQAEADLEHARHALRDEHFEWACFAAQQAAEKAAKAAHAALGQEAWGHVVTELLEALQPHAPAVDEALLDRARALDKLYIPTVEYVLHSTGMPQFILDMRGASSSDPGSSWLLGTTQYRTIGAIAQDGFSLTSRLTTDYDVLVFFDQTTPSVLLPFN